MNRLQFSRLSNPEWFLTRWRWVAGKICAGMVLLGTFLLPVWGDEPQTAEFYKVPTVTDHLNITYPRASQTGDIRVHADRAETFLEGTYTVHLFRGNVRLTQGADTFTSDEMVLWVTDDLWEENELPMKRVLLWMNGNVQIAFVTPRTTSQVTAATWNGRLQTAGTIHFQAPETKAHESVPDSEMYRTAREVMFHDAQLILTQLSGELPGLEGSETATENLPAVEETPTTVPLSHFPETTEETTEEIPVSDLESLENHGTPTTSPEGVVIPAGPLYPEKAETKPMYPAPLASGSVLLQGNVSALDPNVPAPGKTRVSVYPRNDVPLQMNAFKDPQSGKTVVIFDSGVTVLIDGADAYLEKTKPGGRELFGKESPAVGTIDIATDRLVVWTTGDFDSLDFDANTFGDGSTPLEIYMEGNIIFRQGQQEIHADRMYFDIQNKRGIIREAEVFATIPNFEGLIRLRSEEIRIPEEGMLVANNTFLTTSRIGDPMYRFQMGQLMLRSQRQPKINPRTGEPVRDPVTGEPVMEGPDDIIGRDTVVKIGNVPIFYLPYFAAPLENPSQIINKVSIRSDSIFGVQPIIGVDAYRLFGFENPPEGTDWDIQALYYSKRGPGIGTQFSYDRFRPDAGWFSGHRYGFFEFFGIYDTGRDNLGYGRRDLIPETKWRYQLIGKNQFHFGNNMQFRAQLGVISDRNFQEEYFQNSWYTEPDRATQFEIRQEIENRSWALWADVRVNDFHTQTQRLPQFEFYWLGQPLFDDLLTWSSYSQVGYTHLFPDTPPEDPADRALWNPLPWEENREAIRASTRQEISYPFQAGPVKLVPYALGELAYWSEDLQGEPLSRAYGQAGIRASLPFWKYYDSHSKLWNVNGIMHKVEFDVEASYSEASQSAYDLPLYDLIDDRAILDFRHHMQSAIFGGNPIPLKFDSRSYAIRSNLGGWVTSPSTELADDLMLIRFGMHHRWQTKRGMPGQERIIDWATFDMNFNLYPNPDRDNFGAVVGLLDYDFRWHPGDRLTIFSTGSFDFFSDGLRMIDVGGILDRPGKGSLFASIHYLTGPVENVVMRLGYNYWMSPKWASTFVSTFDISGKGNIGESLSLTRVGESFLLTFGVAYDNPSDNLGFHVTLEPRFGKKGNVARLFNIAPPGVYGVD
ncbi:MAG: hypothetical protein Q4D62_08575 [Planctomycetia bacterium]|nr:hypothetical protein [Planctomycetia bacterium]